MEISLSVYIQMYNFYVFFCQKSKKMSSDDYHLNKKLCAPHFLE